MSDSTGASAVTYAPLKAGPFGLSMGLQPLELRDWIEVDERFEEQLREKSRLCESRHSDVFDARPESAAGSREVLELLRAHLPKRFPDLYRAHGELFHNLVTEDTWKLDKPDLHPLDLAGRLVQEDLCLMKHSDRDGLYHLVAASLCFPTRWRLSDKMDRPLHEIHGPVPGYAPELASKMNRFFSKLRVERPVWRVNWSLPDDPALFQPTGHGRVRLNRKITPENVAEKIWLRVERQTLRRLPVSQDILFTIHVHQSPLGEFSGHPDRTAQLAANLRAMPEPMRQYKSLPPVLDAVLTWLDKVSEKQEAPG